MMELDMTERRNINRGYMKLIVWQDAKAYYYSSIPIFQGKTEETQ